MLQVSWTVSEVAFKVAKKLMKNETAYESNKIFVFNMKPVDGERHFLLLCDLSKDKER